MGAPANVVLVSEAVTPVWIHWFRQRRRPGCRKHYDRARFDREVRAMVERLLERRDR